MLSFIKTNNTRFKDALLKENEGLDALQQLIDSREIEELTTPQVLSVDSHQLELTQIEAISPTAEHMKMLGHGLAKLHLQKFERAGFSQDNYIGLNPQKNDWSNNWGEFFVERRLAFQIELIESSTVKTAFKRILEENKPRLIGFLNQTTAFMSLVHGDLWSGNAMFSQQEGKSKVWLIDPAVYYGDREVDLAMTEMFGGFNHHFYQAYDEVYPRTSEYETKKVIYNLYHYLNHFNLFGEGYLSACRRRFEIVKEL